MTKKKDRYAMFYAKQGLVLFITYVVAWVVALVVAFIPLIGWLISLALYILLLVLWIMGWIAALSGEMKEIPIIGKYAKKINL